MKNIPIAKDFIFENTHLTNEEMLTKFAKLHVLAALEEAFKVSALEAWDKYKIYEAYPQDNIK
jgi:hypothetical protein